MSVCPLPGSDLARAAEALVGTPFRLHGRDPEIGLDCIGVLAASLAACGRPAHLPQGYALRNRRLPPLDDFLAGCRLLPALGGVEPGDVVLVQPGAVQIHLAIAQANDRFIHAHARLRRVVSTPLPPHWPRLGHWRLAAED